MAYFVKNMIFSGKPTRKNVDWVNKPFIGEKFKYYDFGENYLIEVVEIMIGDIPQKENVIFIEEVTVEKSI